MSEQIFYSMPHGFWFHPSQGEYREKINLSGKIGERNRFVVAGYYAVVYDALIISSDCGRAMVLGKFQYQEVLLIWIIVG